MSRKEKKKQVSEDAAPENGEEELEKGWERCPECGTKLKSKNLSRHLKKVHGDGLSSRGKPQETPNLIKTRFLPVLVIGIIIVACFSGYILLRGPGEEDDYIGGTDDDPIDGNDGTDDDPIDGNDGTDDGPIDGNDGTDGYDPGDYDPHYSSGSGDDDWWINYPSQNPNAGSSVSHPQWVLDSLKNKPVVIFAHSDDCAPCLVQEQDMDKVLKDLGSNVVYYDLLSDGSDPRAYEVFNIYDANGGQSYIPLTAIVTLIEDGNVKVAWHSSEGATGEEWLRTYIQDAIYYHNHNSANWDGA